MPGGQQAGPISRDDRMYQQHRKNCQHLRHDRMLGIESEVMVENGGH
jgi:hypothetical protein